jgi:hypothetical protein
MHDDHTDTAPLRTIPVPEAVISELRRLRAEADERFAVLFNDTARHAPLILVYDETRDLFDLPIDPDARTRAAEILAYPDNVAMRPVAPSAPETAPVLEKVRAAADALRIQAERASAEAGARRQTEAEQAREREVAATVADAELAWGNLFRPAGRAPTLAWRGYSSTYYRPGGTGPLAVAHLGQGVFVLYETGHRATHLYTLAACSCSLGVSRYRTDTLYSAATLSRALDQILGEAPECADTCAAGNPW